MKSLVGATVRFGLITIPVGIGSTVAKSNEPGFVKLHTCKTPVEVKKPAAKSSKPTGAGPGGTVVKIQQKDYCPACGVEADEVVRGYEYAKGQYAVFTDDELEAIKPPDTKEIVISKFVPRNQLLAPMASEHYFLIPGDVGKHAYSILYRAMSRSKLVALGSEWLFQRKEHPCAVVAINGLLMLQVLHVADDLVEPDFAAEVLGSDKHTREEIEFAEALIGTMTGELNLDDLVSGQRKRKEALIAARIEEVALPVFTNEELPVPDDLMEALRASIAQQQAAK